MSEISVLSCDMCEHHNVCKLKDDYEKYRMPELPNFIRISYACSFWTNSIKQSPKKMRDFQGDSCSDCFHSEVCQLKERVENAMKELETLRREERFFGLAFKVNCRECEILGGQ